MPMAGVPALERLMRQSVPEPNTGCLLWLGCVGSSGYGQFRFNSRRIGPHRAAYILANGEIPDEIQVCHKCDVKLCIEPSHLFTGTRMDNSQDMSMKNRGVKSRKTGFPYGVGFLSDCKSRPYGGRVTFRGRRYTAGSYPTPEAASAAAIALRDRLRAEYAVSQGVAR